MCRIAKQKGFTLLEVMVAMAILAISLAAAIKAATEVTVNTAYLKEKTIAQWVATNKINEIRLQKNWPQIGRSNGDVRMAGVEWYWKLEVKKTPDDNIRRLELQVMPLKDKDKGSSAFITAFMGKPL